MALEHIRGHQLLPDSLRASLPPLYSQESLGLNALAHVKFFTPRAGWAWYASEFDGTDIFFGLVSGVATELGYFGLNELDTAFAPRGLALVERDLRFKPEPLAVLKSRHQTK